MVSSVRRSIRPSVLLLFARKKMPLLAAVGTGLSAIASLDILVSQISRLSSINLENL
jgi:hypothetical protein